MSNPNISNPMYQAFLKAAGTNPEKIAMVNEAKRNSDSIAAEEARQARIKARKEAEEKRKMEELAKSVEETKRREKERKLMSELKPFGYTHTMFMMDYSVEMGIVLAEDLQSAKLKVAKESLFIMIDPEADPEAFEEACKARILRVFPIDLQKGICKIGEYYE